MDIGIVGTGKMGASIIRLISQKPWPITVLAIDENEAEKCRKNYIKGIERSFKRNRISKDDYLWKKNSVRFSASIKEISGAQLVIEAIFEDLSAKIDLFQNLESVLDKNAMMVTNSSSVPVNAIAEKLKHPHRFCGLHFFNPLSMMKPVEIIRTSKTPSYLVEQLIEFCHLIDKKPFVFLDAPGSVTNIILLYFYLEAFYMLESGMALPSRIDAAAKRFFYFGPCESVDVIGLDLLLSALKIQSIPGSMCPVRWTDNLHEGIGESSGREGFYVPFLFRKLLADDRFGKNQSRGIYLYDRGKPMDDNAQYYMDQTGMTAPVSPIQTSREHDLIAKRLMYALFNGAIEAYHRGIGSIEDLDICIKELLWMDHGPFTMMKKIGFETVGKEFDDLARQLGVRFRQKVPAF